MYSPRVGVRFTVLLGQPILLSTIGGKNQNLFCPGLGHERLPPKGHRSHRRRPDQTDFRVLGATAEKEVIRTFRKGANKPFISHESTHHTLENILIDTTGRKILARNVNENKVSQGKIATNVGLPERSLLKIAVIDVLSEVLH